MEKAIFKFNGGAGALLCTGCSCTIKIGYDFTADEWKAMKGLLHLDSQYCDECKGITPK